MFIAHQSWSILSVAYNFSSPAVDASSASVLLPMPATMSPNSTIFAHVFVRRASELSGIVLLVINPNITVDRSLNFISL